MLNSKPKILVMMSGSIACYKACGLISMLVKNGYNVKVAASASALKFIGEATLEGLTGEKVVSDLWQVGAAMEHIHLERWADLIIAAPASAHFVNRCANGVGDDLLTTIFLAHEFKKPFLLAPAMNTAMYLNPVTQKSIGYLKDLGIQILEAASGVLACGETGYGKLLEPNLLFQEIEKALKIAPTAVTKTKETARAQKVLITAGGTREELDDVRYLGNKSTGITGEQIARELCQLGFDVTLDLAKSSSAKPLSELYEVQYFDSFKSLSSLMESQLKQETFDLVIHAAAVSDFSIEKTTGKISSDEDLTLKLKRNPKILNSLKAWSKNKNLKLIAFKLTSELPADQIQSKVNQIFETSRADLVIHNDVQTLQDRKQHQFNIYDRKTVKPVQGILELVGQIITKELL